MQSELGPYEADLLARVRSFVESDVLPCTRDWEAKRSFPDDIWRRLGHLGLFGLALSEERGGLGTSCRLYADTIREIAHGDPALAMNLAAINALCVAHIERFGTPEQQDKYLPGILKGEIKLAWGLTEPDAGSDARRVSTFASADPNRPGHFRIDGEKMFITNGGKADLIILIARVSEKELSAFLVETAQPGFQLVRRIDTTAVSASNTVQFKLDGAVGWHTPCTFEEAIGLLYRGRIGIAAMAVGIAEKAHALALDYAGQREQFNRKLWDMQSVQNMIADNAVDVEAARLLLYSACAAFDRGEKAVVESSIAKLFASEAATRVTNRALQIHGGRGLTYDYLIEKLWRDAKLTEIGEGCSEIQRMVIAKQLIRAQG